MRFYRTDSRYYYVKVERDLFGRRVIVRCWGGIRSRLGGLATEPMVGGRLKEIEKERAAHGYVRFPD